MDKFGLFESLAADDSDSRIAARQSLAVANKRVNDQFGAFLDVANSPTERTARLDYVRPKINEVVSSVCEEYGGDPQKVEASILKGLTAAKYPLTHDDKEKEIQNEYYGTPNGQDLLDFPPEPKENPKKRHDAALVKEAPGNKHLPYATDKRNRQYEHIKEGLEESGKGEDDAKEEAARTVNKQRAEKGETKDSKTADIGPNDIPPYGRDQEAQGPLDREIDRLIGQGYSPEEAEQIAQNSDRSPGAGYPPTVHSPQHGQEGPGWGVGASWRRTAAQIREALTAKDFRLVADLIATAPVSEQEREPLAQHAATYLQGSNPNFDVARFIQAAMGVPSTGRDTFDGEGGPPLDEPEEDYSAINNYTGPVTGSTHEARRPKMCPYHREVTDISLASGDPAAGFNAMSAHAWGPQHCQGEFEGNCNFKREMVTQSYWDQKAEQAQERRQQREQLMQEQDLTPEPEAFEPGELDQELAEAPSAVGEGMDEGIEKAETMGQLEPMAASTHQADGMVSPAAPLPPQPGVAPMPQSPPVPSASPPASAVPPQAVGGGAASPVMPDPVSQAGETTPGVGNAPLDQLRALVQRNQGTVAHQKEAAPPVPGLAQGPQQLQQQFQQQHQGVPPAHPGQAAGGPSPLAHPGQQAEMVQGMGTPMQQAQVPPHPIPQGIQQGVNPAAQRQPILPPQVPGAIGNPLSLMGATHEAEANRDGGGAVKTEDLPAANADGLSKEPSGPAINKDTWKPNALNQNGNLKPVDTEMSGSPVPNEEIDILEAIPSNRSDDFLDGTRSVTETQDLPSANDDGYTTDKNTETIHTDTWSQNNGASPVTNEVQSSFLTPEQVRAAVLDYETE